MCSISENIVLSIKITTQLYMYKLHSLYNLSVADAGDSNAGGCLPISLGKFKYILELEGP